MQKQGAYQDHITALSEPAKRLIIYIVSAAFIALNGYLIHRGCLWSVALPVSLLIVFVLITSAEYFFLIIAFLTPLSVNLLDTELNAGISIPSEPLLVAMTLIFIFGLLMGIQPEKRQLYHPVTIAILLNLSWMFVTVLTSTLPLISAKAYLSRLWFVLPMFFMGITFFGKLRNIKRFLWCYALALLIVIVYTTYRHYLNGFAEKTGTWVMKPFYNDHTAYGSIMALLIPVFITMSFIRRFSPLMRIACFGAAIIFMGALALSFSRAAWTSMVIAMAALPFILLKIKFRWVVLSMVMAVMIFYTFRYEIVDVLSKNKQDSSANFVEHVQSISNISSDASNLERINRWQSALRMFGERPFWGWGPGTYQFQYAPFQRSQDKTVISTNFGDVGNAHSEYIGPLAESGVFGMLTFFAVLLTSLSTGFRIYRKASTSEVRLLALGITLGLMTYFIHGTLNNFLDTDKLSVTFWAFLAILVAMDRGLQKQESGNDESDPAYRTQ